VVKVIDFGVARLHEGDEPGRTMTVTETGGVLGTPAYMAPEQLISGEIDTRVDVWAMGVILAELLAGRRPFAVSDADGGMLEEQRRIREEEPSSPSDELTTMRRRDPAEAAALAARRGREVRDLVRELRRELDWVVLRCVARRPDDRYASISALGDELGRFLRHEPLEAGPLEAAYRVRKFVRRHRIAVSAAATVMVLLIAGIAGTSWGLLKATEAAKAERLARETAERRLDQFGEINTFNRRILTAVDPDVARGLDKSLLERTIESSVDLIDDDADPLVRSQLHLTLGEAWSHLDRADQALELMRKSLDEANRSASIDGGIDGLTDELGIADIEASLSKVLIDASSGLDSETQAAMRSEAESMLRHAIEVNERELGADHVRTLQDRANLAWLMMITGRLEEGLELLRDVHDRRLTLFGPNAKPTLNSASLLSDILIKLGRGTPSRYEEAGDVVRELLGEHPDPSDPGLSPATLLLLNNLAIVESRLGHQDERLRLLDGIATQVEPLFGANSTTTMTVLYNHATTLIDRGRFDEATATLERCLAGYRARTAPGSTQIVRTLSRLGQVARLAGDRRMATGWFEQVANEAGNVAADETVPARTRDERHLDAAGACLQMAAMARADEQFADARGWLAWSEHHLKSTESPDPILPGLAAAERIELALADPSAATDAGESETADAIGFDDTVAQIDATLATLPMARRRERATMMLATGRLAWRRDGDATRSKEIAAEIEALLAADGTVSSRPVAEALAAWRDEIADAEDTTRSDTEQ
jgi:tetratricopeptide (TPR) repeat protein